MTTSLAPLAPSVEAATAALAPARATYGRFGYDKVLEAELVKRLTTPSADERKQRRAVEGIRNLLWNYFPGGGTATAVARDVMRELGHEEFATAKWL